MLPVRVWFKVKLKILVIMTIYLIYYNTFASIILHSIIFITILYMTIFNYFTEIKIHTEFKGLQIFLFALISGCFLFSFITNNIFSLFLFLEIINILIYVIILNYYLYYLRNRTIYNKIFNYEFIIKYFIINSFNAVLFLFGLLIIYLVTLEFDYNKLSIIITTISTEIIEDSLIENMPLIILEISIILIIISFLFKLGLFPTLMWLLDIYESISFPLIMLILVGYKFIIFCIINNLLFFVFYPIIYVWQPILLFVALSSLFVGSFGALYQNKIKRFIGYTSVAQSSYLILSMSCGSYISYLNSFTYLFYYSITIILFLFILHDMTIRLKKPIIYITDLTIYKKYISNYHIGIFIILIMSFANIPPLTMFFVKYYLLQNIFLITQSYIIILFIISCSICSVYYYLRLIKIFLFDFNFITLSYKKSNFITLNYIFTFGALIKTKIINLLIDILLFNRNLDYNNKFTIRFQKKIIKYIRPLSLNYFFCYSTLFVHIFFSMLYFSLILLLIVPYFL
jgi:NADH-quinone oxidoreductase subunit N